MRSQFHYIRERSQANYHYHFQLNTHTATVARDEIENDCWNSLIFDKVGAKSRVVHCTTRWLWLNWNFYLLLHKNRIQFCCFFFFSFCVDFILDVKLSLRCVCIALASSICSHSNSANTAVVRMAFFYSIPFAAFCCVYIFFPFAVSFKFVSYYIRRTQYTNFSQWLCVRVFMPLKLKYIVRKILHVRLSHKQNKYWSRSVADSPFLLVCGI